jgi:hypothetical protein
MDSEKNRLMGLVDLAVIITQDDLLPHAQQILIECGHLAVGKKRYSNEAFVFMTALMKTCTRSQLRSVAYLFNEFLPPQSPKRMSDLMDDRLRMHIRCKDSLGWIRARHQASFFATRGILPHNYRFRYKRE